MVSFENMLGLKGLEGGQSRVIHDWFRRDATLIQAMTREAG